MFYMKMDSFHIDRDKDGAFHNVDDLVYNA